MAHLDIDTVLGWRGNTVRDRHGEKIGSVGDIFLDRNTDRPAWLGVKTGWFGSKQSYVSLASAEARGGELHVPYDADVVKNAPHIDPDVALTVEEEERLYRHYGVDYFQGGSPATSGHGGVADATDADAATGVPGTAGPAGGTTEPGAVTAGGADGRGRSVGDAMLDDNTMIRSEEQVRLGHTERRPTERARLVKVMVTENVKQVVPVRREVIQVEHESAPEGNIESVEDLGETRDPGSAGRGR